MTAAYFAPAVDDTAVKTARANAAVLGVQQRYESDTTLHDLLFRQIFATGPAHYPPLPTTVAQLTSISTAQVSAFAKRAFRAENSVLTLTGNVDASSITAVTDGSGAGAMDSPYDSKLAGRAGLGDGFRSGRRRRPGLDRSPDRRRKGRDRAGFHRRLSLSRARPASFRKALDESQSDALRHRSVHHAARSRASWS